jgi:glycosyltransferase involved in cell wall biosynthesis
MPEVGGDAALYFPPDDATQLVTQILRLLDDDGLRDHLVHAGALQAAQYSWSRSALATLTAFDRGITAHQARR